MRNLTKLLPILLALSLFSACKKEVEQGIDYRDQFTGTYTFTKYEKSHHGEYIWESDDMGGPIEVWTMWQTEEIEWESTGTVEKGEGVNQLIIDYGNGEKFGVIVFPYGALSCLNDNCSYLRNIPDETGQPWAFSGSGSPAAWDEATYLLDMGDNIPEYGLPYGGWSYQKWWITGTKL